MQKNCKKQTIETYVIGGEAPNVENAEGNIEEQETILALADEVNLKAVRFNLPQENDLGIYEVFTPTCLHVSKHKLFHWTPGNGNAGIDFPSQLDGEDILVGSFGLSSV